MVKIFKKELKSEHKLARYDVFDKRTNKTYVRYSIQIASKEIVNDLNNLGIYSNKSFNCSMPNIPKKYFWDFIRGIFDGDGTIHQGKNENVGRLRFGIIGSEKLLIEINNFFKTNNILKVYVRKTKYGNSKGNLIRLDCSKFNDLNMLKNMMYDDSNGLRLTRKYKKFQTLKEYKLGQYDRTKNLRKIEMYLNENLIKTFINIHDVTSYFNTKSESIYLVLRGKRKNYNGYSFKYI